jgi:hypothetical protein
VQETITTKFYEDGSKEVHEVITDEQGTREKATYFDSTQQQLENGGDNNATTTTNGKAAAEEGSTGKQEAAQNTAQ